MPEKVCRVCQTLKPKTDFYSDPEARDGFYNQCKLCMKIRTREHRKSNPELWAKYMRKSTLKRLYSISLQDYENLLIAQNRKCAICSSDHVKRKGINNFAIDHDHKTGRVRGLLCHNCNRGIGHFKDSQELLNKAIVYLSPCLEIINAEVI